MSALDQQRLMMEQLMGLERDVSLSERTGRTRMFYDPVRPRPLSGRSSFRITSAFHGGVLWLNPRNNPFRRIFRDRAEYLQVPRRRPLAVRGHVQGDEE